MFITNRFTSLVLGAVVAAVSSGGAMCSVKCFCWMMIFYLTSAKVGCCLYHTVEIEREEDKYKEESEEHVEDIEQLSCEISESKCKSSTNLKRHDQRFHLKRGTDNEFKCDFRNEIFADRKKAI